MMNNFIFPDILLYLLDMVGVIACAIAGTLLAQHKGFDIAGCILVSMVNAIGGGTLRDMALDRHPLFWMTDLNYIIVITVTSLVLQIFFHLYHKIDNALKLFDAIGLAAFSVIGFNVALAQDMSPVIAMMMAVWTAIIGGLLRDIICNEIPLLLQREIYITASIVGSLTYLVLDHWGVDTVINEFIMLFVIFTVRMLALKFDWHLPSIRLVD
ncbi:trimeric intracellular cation channel family protein [Psychrobacter sp. AOP22-C1-22]|uniref:trimeric intracellular cation channel family protein n=1 Tax=unclassified Psychrobacter TaxID=196806 RepID=UPI001787B0C3|nr:MULTISPECIES: trimeric intracellular cation channel family protein [unclassified Psychrobacter]MBE0405555.1 trimeric intracellular cation channel family protein [Psychrobacter sp. FME6]MBE0444542.1 trimeric intracellular cation channel family protein [Psychrobacter sp. FME5]MDN5801536.1 trimeric intracellular cation channel family protein [Psychrobacter sp.]MDN5891155.1 trimeric intracellular cation channel family protein [Psychrobacter sp.]